MDKPNHRKKRQRVSDYADQYSVFGKEKYPTSKMPKKSRFSTSTMSRSKKSTKEQGMKEMVESESVHPSTSTTGIYHSEWEVNCSNSLDAYRSLIYQHDAYATLNNKLSVFAILDFDFSNNILKKQENTSTINHASTASLSGKYTRCSHVQIMLNQTMFIPQRRTIMKMRME